MIGHGAKADPELLAMSNAEWLAASVGEDAQPSETMERILSVGKVGELGGFPLIRHPSCPPGSVFVVNPDMMFPRPELSLDLD